MSRISWILLCLCLLTARPLSAQEVRIKNVEPTAIVSRLGDILPDSMTLRGSMQGLAIHGRYAYMLRHGGECVVINRHTGKFKAKFQLPNNTSHCNNANFGGRFRGKPLLYVSECYKEKSCLVYRITPKSAQLVQRINYASDNFPIAHDWCVDPDSNHLYVYGGKRGGTLYLKQFHLPKIGEKQVILTDDDVIRTIPINGVKVAQGSKIEGNVALLPDGIKAGELWLHAMNLDNGDERWRLDLNPIGCEPEGIDVKGRWLYLSFHTKDFTENKLYRWDYRKLQQER